MRRAYQFAGDHPVIFALLMLLLWLIVTAAAVILISLLFSLPLDAYAVQSLGTLAATALLLAICWRFGWLRPAGITSPGSWKAWLYALAALAYLVTMRWALANAEVTDAVGKYYEDRLHDVCAASGGRIRDGAGLRHMGALVFDDLGEARRYAGVLASGGLDISVQSYKSDCPPVCLTKLPLIAGYEVVDVVIQRMLTALES